MSNFLERFLAGFKGRLSLWKYLMMRQHLGNAYESRAMNIDQSYGELREGHMRTLLRRNRENME